ncbi:MAG TPA: hypothetical protein PLD47_05940 [Aggregatilineales bacterium]|nr:hypothetical protein [Anaerolineales bacterium]HRE47249.1 hypothetical protein [Aggregatilineales bacterium]
MRTRLVTCIVVSILLATFLSGAVVFAPSVMAQGEPPISRSPFLHLLAYTPDMRSDDYPLAGVISYVNLHEIARIGNVTVSDLETFEKDEDIQIAWRWAMSRITTPPEFVAYERALMPTMPEVVGMNWFAINAALEFGVSPRNGVFIDFRLGDDSSGLDLDMVTKALTKRGFAVQDVESVPVWHRFDDGKMGTPDRFRGDPFGADIGLPERIQLYNGEFAGLVGNGRNWTLAKAMIGAVKETGADLLDSPDYAVLAQALTDPAYYPKDTGEQLSDLLQVYIIPPIQGESTPSSAGDPLPPYMLMAMADRQKGSQQFHQIVLIYPSRDFALRASDILLGRLRTFLPEALITEHQVEFTEPLVYTAKDGWSAAIVGVHYPLPADVLNSQTGKMNLQGEIYRYLSYKLWQGQLTPIGLKP